MKSDSENTLTSGRIGCITGFNFCCAIPMHLKQLKLVGFKSFVDSTIVRFPSQLLAVVGPNGCGKSNIIDALRWVMGESSARNLRGDSMSDVIFNGSSNRKPLGQASVELIFDNSLGRLTGPFANYGELSVKRLITRDGDSSYYLNGSRCRRRDISDIFLGTGVGARGYSIIGQGTISQLIEAKPEELRMFLEEAAGVSKYKERRKETLQRIAHTRENLTRIADIRDELGKQLQRLERQAQAAERYLLLKKKEQLYRAEILAFKWHELKKQQEVKQHELQALTLSYEQQRSLHAKATKERVIVEEALHDVDQQTQQIQTTFYQLATEIARLEETLQQQAREKKRIEHDQHQMQADWQAIAAQVQQDKEDLLGYHHTAATVNERLIQLREQFTQQEQHWQDLQRQQTEWEGRWQKMQTQSNEAQKEFQVAQVKAQHVEQKKLQTLLRLEQLNQEQHSISLADLQQSKKECDDQRVKLISNQQTELLELKQCQEKSTHLRNKVQEVEVQLHQLQDEFYRKNSECTALMAAQRAARQGQQAHKTGVKEWADRSRLVDVLQVDDKWQAACELVLDDMLHAYVLETFDDLWPQQQVCQQQGERVVTLKTPSEKTGSYPRLADKIQGAIPANVHSLEHIFAAEHTDEAVSWLPELSDHQSVITAEGFWWGKGWVKFVQKQAQDELGFLARKQKIAELTVIVEELQQKIESLKAERDQYHQQLQENVQNSELQQQIVTVCNDALRTNSVALSTSEQAIKHAEERMTALISAGEELQLILQETAADQFTIEEQLVNFDSRCRDYAEQQEQSHHEKQRWLNTMSLQNKQVEQLRSALHQEEMEYDRGKNKIQQLTERIDQEQMRLNMMQERLEQLALLSLQVEEPEVELKNQLTQSLMNHAEIELQLTLSREQGSQLRMEREELEKNISGYDAEVKRIHELINQLRIKEQSLAVRADSVQESLNETGFHAANLLSQLTEGITQSLRENELIALVEEINCLGAINLAAIDEFASEQQRKIYLDEQHNDLSEALITLECAIEKIDRETRTRLEHTFEAVNTSFKALFPRLFGGGKAQLELTCENLLEAGIVVMAQPPGKRNSTIHLLSGGEKAMTAVALVFAIFQLNPSPFCMLDEVDAPLDDVNVGRFCIMVKEMSEFVQFLIITHNKVTMELADHLMGVTMREPGVSRIVAVDVKQALTME